MTKSPIPATWKALHDVLRTEVLDRHYHMWVEPMRPERYEDQELELSLPGVFHLNWVKEHLLSRMTQALAEIDPGCSLRLTIREEDEALPIPEPVEPPAVTDGPGPRPPPTSLPSRRPTRGPAPSFTLEAPSMNPRYVFETFVTGPSNQMATAAAQRVAEDPGISYNPLFIYGRVGLGKTHLVQAIGQRMMQRNPNARVQYETTEQFVNNVVQGIRFESMDQVREAYRKCDLLIIDDIQFIAGKEACQIEFFNTFNALHNAQKAVVITSDKLPKEIPDLAERVRSRFGWGLVVDLQPPELETRLAILWRLSERDNIPLTDEVANFIAQSVRSNVRELEGCLVRVGAHSALQHRPISLELAQEALRDVVSDHAQLTADAIIIKTAAYFDVKVSELKGAGRSRKISRPRQIAMYLCRKLLGASYPEIGRAFGGKDHTTALNAYKRIHERCDDADISPHLKELERSLQV